MVPNPDFLANFAEAATFLDYSYTLEIGFHSEEDAEECILGFKLLKPYRPKHQSRMVPGVKWTAGSVIDPTDQREAFDVVFDSTVPSGCCLLRDEVAEQVVNFSETFPYKVYAKLALSLGEIDDS